MNYKIIATETFERKIKRLSKKFPSLKDDLFVFFNELSKNPNKGISLGKNCYKIRFSITSKSKGKLGGSRIFTFVRVSHEIVYLLDIIDKFEESNISDRELKKLIDVIISKN